MAYELSEDERLLRLALCVKERGAITFADIRRRVGCSYCLYEHAPDHLDRAVAGEQAYDAAKLRHDQKVRRMFERDKETLQGYGVFFSLDEDNRYSIDVQASYAAPVSLTAPEASLLRMVASALLADDSYPLKNELRMALVKIGDELDVPDLLPGMDRPDPGKGASPAPAREMARLKKLRKSLANRKRLSFDYTDAAGAASQREVEPFGCFFYDRHGYLVAFDPEAGSERTFRLDRMEHLRVNGTRPSSPDFDARPFHPQDHCGLPFQIGDGRFEAQIRFGADDKWRARRLSQQRGSFDTRDDALVWTVEAADAHAVAAWCVEHGPGVVPVAPDEARTAYEEGLRAILAACDGETEARR